MTSQTTVSIAIERLMDNWKTNKTVPHSLHNTCSRICSFPPSLPDYFIRKFTREGDFVFDAWSGKGTVPFEALRNGRIGIGNDKSPEAFVLTHAKVRSVKFEHLQNYILKLKKEMDNVWISKDLMPLDRKANVFYSKKTFEQILKLKEVLLNENSDVSIFIKAIVLGLLHGSSSNSFSLTCSHAYSMSPNYVKKYARIHKLRRPTRDPLQCILRKAELLMKDPLPSIKGIALNDDSRNISLEAESVDMILTSPPYFDVQTYAWCNWLRLWFLGYNYREIRKVLAESGSEVRYRDFMKASIQELYRVLKPKGRCFIVIGDVRRSVGGKFKIMNTAEFLLPLLTETGFIVEKIVVDTIPSNRRVMTYIQEEDGIKTERTLYLRKMV